jgi:molybdopterin-guanine dinucleotide biosynthesis protein A
MTGIILAGGKSSRINTNKAFLKIGETPIIEVIIKILQKVFNQIIIVTNNTEKFQYIGVKIVKDLIPEKGPLGGIYSGLKISGDFHNFVVACDMPLLNTDLIKFMLENKNGFDAIVPKLDASYQPLYAIYSKNCTNVIKTQIQDGNLKITDFLHNVRLKEISKETIKMFDPKLLSFFNINTYTDYKEVLQIIENGRNY